jgi:hypothetical protein
LAQEIQRAIDLAVAFARDKHTVAWMETTDGKYEPIKFPT